MDAGQVYGRGMSFPPRVGPDGRIAWSEGEANVREGVRVVLLTEPGERLLAPSFGGGLSQYLFEPNTVATRHTLAEAISQAINQWEPRVALDSVAVEADPNAAEAAVVTLVYRLVATQAREQVSLNVTFMG
jgi:uncharacterized protein